MSEKRAPRNTAAEVDRDPLSFIASAMRLGSSGAIERQEASGQQDFVNSDTLPTDVDPKSKEGLERAGVKFLGTVEGDDLFQYVELPKGWTKRPTGHSMHSELVDDKGRKRAGIFYKAAFYDRKARMHATYRYNIDRQWDREDAVVCDVKDGDRVIFSTEPIAYGDGMQRWEIGERAHVAAVKWLSEHFPLYEDPAAYWD